MLGSRPETPAALLPLVIRDRVPALLYVEDDSALDLSALELLTHEAGSWLELLAFRRTVGDALVPPVAAQPPSVAPLTAAPPEPLAPVAPPASVYGGGLPEAVTPYAAVSEPVFATPPEPPPSFTAPPAAAVAPLDPFSAASAPAAAAPLPAALSRTPEDNELHERARRFAKLLVEEIKLYNQAQVQQGRQSRDLYDRLRADIEKSRAAYLKRYSTVIRDKDYFTQELIRILADNDRSLLGANFPG